MVHGRDKLGLYISRIKHGRRHLEKYWSSGKPCPVVLSFGQDPLLFLTGSMPLPADVNELDLQVRIGPADVDDFAYGLRTFDPVTEIFTGELFI